MSLPSDYLTYDKRSHGQDIHRHDWCPAPDAPNLNWPNGTSVAVTLVVPVEWFPLTPSGTPFVHPHGMKTPYPDLRHFTTRDYGARVGVFRILNALDNAGVRGVFPLSAAMLDRAGPLIDVLKASDHEIAAAGLHTDALHWGGMDPQTERRYIGATRATFAAQGIEPVTWMSPARNQSRETLDLLAEHGFSVCLDWETDQLPILVRTKTKPVLTVPVFNELEDARLILDRRQTETQWAEQVREAVAVLKAEATSCGARSLGVQLTPYVLGQPFRIHAVSSLAKTLARDDDIWMAPARAVADAYHEMAKAP